jgi:hypothetical protein
MVSLTHRRTQVSNGGEGVASERNARDGTRDSELKGEDLMVMLVALKNLCPQRRKLGKWAFVQVCGHIEPPRSPHGGRLMQLTPEFLAYAGTHTSRRAQVAAW